MKKYASAFAGVALVGFATSCGGSATSDDVTTEAEFPTRAIEYVVPTSAGGGQDTVARLLTELFEQYDIVDGTIQVTNRPGGSTSVGMSYVKEHTGDGHMIMNVTSSFLTTPLLDQSDLAYTDFTPIAMLASDRKVLVVHGDSPYHTIEDLIDAARTAPGSVTHGGGAVTTAEAIAGFKLREQFGVEWEYVSFDGGSDALTAVLGGHVTFAIPGPVEVAEHVRAGRLRVLATTGAERLEDYEDAPTFIELGIDDLPEAGRGIIGPPDMSEQAVTFWSEAIREVTRTDEWQQYLEDGAMEDRYLDREGWADWLAENHELYVDLIPAMGL